MVCQCGGRMAQRRKKRGRSLNPRSIYGEDRFEFVEFLLGRIVVSKCRCPLDLGNERMQRAPEAT
jgi:hypothetical protein